MKLKAFALAMSVMLSSCGSGGAESENTSCSGILFGDSVSASYNAAEKISKLSNISIKDLSQGGEATINAVQGIPIYWNNSALKYTNFYDVIDNSSENLIIIRYGAAEAVWPGDENMFYNNLSSMVKYATMQDKKVLLVGVTQFTNEFAEKAATNDSIVAKVAKENNVEFVNIRALILRDTVDGIHPTFDYSDKQIDLISSSVSCN